MSEIRKDPLSYTWVILATERAKRPRAFKQRAEIKERRAKPRPCPLCEEASLPIKEHAIWPGVIDKKTGAWKTRVLPNKYPALRPGLELAQTEVDTVFHLLSGVGGHEVIVETPRHEDILPVMPLDQMEAMIRTYCQRYNYWRSSDPRIAYVLIFKNYGLAAGASLEHPHSQLAATPIIPPRIFEELTEAKKYYEVNKECIYCRLIEAEKEAETSRVILENDTMFASCPFASRFPCEVIILPKRHSAAFEDITQKEVSGLAKILSSVFKRVDAVLGDPPYNYMIHVAPLRTPGLLYYHWHIEIIPRLTMPAGFEWGTDIYINVVSPEEAARALREAE
ncbi:MAG: galactose-1-phosphate uridylyltransferase [Actinomycetota bacterium]|nr:galactose-1-phosphate uridylyltransferase [Actinomycetota bacterium]